MDGASGNNLLSGPKPYKSPTQAVQANATVTQGTATVSRSATRDTVNVASRLEAASRELDCSCVVSDELMKRAQQGTGNGSSEHGGFEARHGVQLRGRQTPIDVWTV